MPLKYTFSWNVFCRTTVRCCIDTDISLSNDTIMSTFSSQKEPVLHRPLLHLIGPTTLFSLYNHLPPACWNQPTKSWILSSCATILMAAPAHRESRQAVSWAEHVIVLLLQHQCGWGRRSFNLFSRAWLTKEKVLLMLLSNLHAVIQIELLGFGLLGSHRWKFLSMTKLRACG